MIYADYKNSEDKEQLYDELKNAKNRNWYRRLQIVKLSAGKMSVQQLSKMFDLCEAVIRNYVNTYNENGLKGLFPSKSSGRPSKIAHWTKEDWDKVMAQTPDQYEKLNTASRQWTFERLALYVKEYHGVEVTIPCVYYAFKSTGRRTGRSKLRVGSPDPEYKAKRSSAEELRNLPKRDN
jgi:transposase